MCLTAIHLNKAAAWTQTEALISHFHNLLMDLMDVVTVQLSFMTYKHVQADTSLVKVLRANVLFKQTHTFLYISLSKMALKNISQ